MRAPASGPTVWGMRLAVASLFLVAVVGLKLYLTKDRIIPTYPKVKVVWE